MKKQSLTILLAVIGIFTKAQVGISTTSPRATLDITAKNATGTTSNVDGLLVPRVDRQRAFSMTSIPTSTLIYVNNLTGTQGGIAANVDALGYYYFDGSLWVKLNVGSPVNMYNSNGTLNSTRTVNQAGFSLAFNNANLINAFSVDGSTFSVDAINKRIGIGTTTPSNKLVVTGKNGQPSDSGSTITNATLRIDGETNHALDFGTFADSPYGSYISSHNKVLNSGLPIVLNPVGGNVGIGIASPLSLLHLGNNIGSSITAAEGKKLALYNDGSLFSGLGISLNTLQFHASSPIAGSPGMVLTNTGNVGIGITSPQATLDITAKNATGTTSNVDGLLVPRVDRQRAFSMTAIPTSTLIYVNNLNGTQGGIAANVDALGYYYFDGSLWVKLNVGSPVNMYNSNGTLNSTRTVNQAGFSLAFNNANLINAFSVDGSTFSVDAINKRIGIGTTTPSNKLVVTGKNAQPSDSGSTITNATLRIDGETNHALDFGTFADSPYGSYISSHNKVLNSGLPLVLNPVGGNVGIGITIPTAKLHTVSSGQYTAFQMQDGSEGTNKVLISDATGKATWATSSGVTPAVLGTINTTSKTVNSSTLIGSSLTLAPGRWLVYIGQLVDSSVAATTNNNLWMRITLSSSSSTISTTNFSFLGSSLVSGWLAPSISGMGGFSFLSGIIPVKVTNSTTLYTWFANNSPAGTPPSATVGSHGENYFFAVPMN
ncbi:hypothetical protein SAMN05444360_10468 [Chryseobacterium carnipullorum]|uniref:hypothetical protein n=1 Tax=Chryseobacterium carnipullorum TaxID=1124835 RepID=UPI00091ADC39|nr:hypothetical protein [Chryseobacterium carnipullorum]SHL75259.1 hypothetical protein SAMN05444360_10468 [Chryseobacterium carnipullorum]